MVTASAFTRPARTCVSEEARLSNISWICPPMRSCIAGAAPLYGMCVICTPASDLKSSPARWPALPVLPEPKLSLPGLALA